MVGAIYHRDVPQQARDDKEENKAGLIFPTEFVEATVDAAYAELQSYLKEQRVSHEVRDLLDNLMYGMALQRYYPVERQWRQGVAAYNREVTEMMGGLAWGIKRLHGGFYDGAGILLMPGECEMPLVEEGAKTGINEIKGICHISINEAVRN